MPTNPTIRETIRNAAKHGVNITLYPQTGLAITDDLDTLDTVRDERDSLRDDVVALREETEAARAARDEARAELGRLRAEDGVVRIAGEMAATSATAAHSRIVKLRDDLKAVRAELDAARAARDEADATNFKLAAELEQYRRGDLTAHPDGVYQITMTYPNGRSFTNLAYRIDGEWRSTYGGIPLKHDAGTIVNPIRIGDIPA